MKRQYYYQVIGKNKYVLKCLYTKAESMADAKIKFYCDGGTDVKYVLRIDKKQFLKRSAEG